MNWSATRAVSQTERMARVALDLELPSGEHAEGREHQPDAHLSPSRDRLVLLDRVLFGLDLALVGFVVGSVFYLVVVDLLLVVVLLDVDEECAKGFVPIAVDFGWRRSCDYAAWVDWSTVFGSRVAS
jgi:hypothetical protein